MAVFLYPLFTITLYLLFRRFRKLMHEPLTRFNGSTILLVVIGTLIYDNLVVSVGALLGEGGLALGLNLPRFLFRLLFLPLLLVSLLEFAARVEMRWANWKAVMAVVWLAALALAGYGVWQDGLTPELQAAWFQGTLRYERAAAGTPIPAQAVGAAALAIGLLIWLKGRWAWLFLGAAAFLAGGLLQFPPAGPLPAALAAVLFAWSLVATEQRAQGEGFTLTKDELSDRLGKPG
jgi:hypothetical protein